MYLLKNVFTNCIFKTGFANKNWHAIKPNQIIYISFFFFLFALKFLNHLYFYQKDIRAYKKKKRCTLFFLIKWQTFGSVRSGLILYFPRSSFICIFFVHQLKNYPSLVWKGSIYYFENIWTSFTHNDPIVLLFFITQMLRRVAATFRTSFKIPRILKLDLPLWK